MESIFAHFNWLADGILREVIHPPCESRIRSEGFVVCESGLWLIEIYLGRVSVGMQVDPAARFYLPLERITKAKATGHPFN